MADLVVTEAIASAAEKGLRLVEEGKAGDGLVPRTITDARLMADQKPLSERKVRAMPGWFARHATDKKAGWDKAGEETPGYVAWLLWGGDTAADWAKRKVDELNNENRSLNDSMDDEITPRQASLVEEYVSNAEEYGPFDTSTGANGAHYAPAEVNPFKAEGLICANCELYQPISDTEGRCAIVEGPLTDGHIEPEAICKLWVIPESKLAAPEAAREAVMNTETRVIGAADLRNNPDLLSELREGDGNVTEVRVAPSDLECRANEDGSWTLIGMASVFNSQSEDLGGFREVIQRGAFRKVLKRDGLDVLALWNHDSQLILGRTTSGTLQLRETPQGLEYQVTVAPTTYGNDLKVLMERGDVHASSFAFRVDSTGQQWEHQPDGTLLRTITEFSDLTDVSPVSVPAYSATSATVARNQDSSNHDSEQAAEGAAAQQGERAESDVRQTDDAKSARDSKAFWLAHMRLNRRA